MKPLHLHTDGSALGNPGPGGWGAIIQDGKKDIELKGGEPHTTNNRMEMKAVIEGVKWIKKHHPTVNAVTLFSDSSLVVKSLNEGWKRKANLDLWAEMDEALHGLSLKAKWVKGHADNLYNQRCDALAVSEAEREARKQKKSNPTVPASGAPPAKGVFQCGQCRKSSAGRLGYLPETGMIRADCAHCGRYIKFAPPTPENLRRAKARPLLTKTQLEQFQGEMTQDGTPLTDRDLKLLKGLTLDEARAQFRSQDRLF